MIIQMTVKDSEYTEILERFTERVLEHPERFNLPLPKNGESIKDEDIQYLNRIKKYLSTFGNKKLSKEEQDELETAITKLFYKYVSTFHEEKYLKANFKVKVCLSIFSRDQHDEYLYYFPKSVKYIVQ